MEQDARVVGISTCGIDMKLIEKKGEPVKTQVKIPKKMLPLFKSFDGLKPDKTSKYYNYYILDGDLINIRKEK